MDGLKENRIPVGWAKQKDGNEYSKYVGQRYMAQRSYYFCITNDFKTQKNKEMLLDICNEQNIKCSKYMLYYSQNLVFSVVAQHTRGETNSKFLTPFN